MSGRDISSQLATIFTALPAAKQHYILEQTTFEQVYRLAAGLRHHFQGREEQAVCLAADNKAVMAASLLASLAGGPPLLLPFGFSRQAMERLQELTGYQSVIADQHYEYPAGVDFICPLQQEISGEPASLELVEDGNRPLLQIFTGGSTGSPQLWSKSGANIFGEALFLADKFQVQPSDTIVATVSPYHIYGLLFSVVLPLVSGASVPAAIPSFPSEIAEQVETHQSTILASVPAHYRALAGRSLAPSLRLAFSSAGMLPEQDNQAFCQHHDCGIIEVYGSTETGGIATRKRSQGETSFTPFSTVDWQIADERLLVRSPYISADLPLNSDGFFVSNDRVKKTEQGFMLLGRADTIVKVGGKRVDIDEIKQLICQHSQVSDCLVLALASGDGREYKLAALVAGLVKPEQLRSLLEEKLEPYARPRRLKVVAEIPMKANGKVDREAAIKLLEL